jgi:hypothetical protein
LSTALLAAIERSIVLCEIDLPNGTTWRLTTWPGGFQSISKGFYEGRLVGDPTGWSEQIGDTNNAMQINTPQVTLADDDWLFRNLVGCGVTLDNRPVRLYRAAPVEDVPAAADWLQYYAGVLDDYSESGTNRWQIKLRPDDGKMRSSVLDRQATIADWPNLPSGIEGTFLPLVIGKHSYEGSPNVTAAGAISTFSVDGTANHYQYVSLGYVNVLRVYVGATLKTLTTDYTVLNPQINGVRHTILHMVADPAGAAVTVDVEGQYAVGTGSGAPMMLATDVIRLVLNNWVFGSWLDGAWLTESTSVNTSAANAVATSILHLADGSAYCSAIYLSDNSVGYDVLNQWLLAHGVWCYWNGLGQLVLWYDDPNTLPTITNVLHEADCIPGGFAVVTSKDQLLAGSIATWGQASGSATRYQLEVDNPRAVGDKTETISLIGGPNTWP